MEEELNEHELEEQLYALLHYVDETQENSNVASGNEITTVVENAPRSSVRRYWRTSGEQNNPYQKINTPKDATPISTAKNSSSTPANNTKPKPAKSAIPGTKSPVDLSIFQSPIPQNVKKTIEILDHNVVNQVVLESSDEDEVIEVALPPKPTITIESSDEDELEVINESKSANNDKPNVEHKTTDEREISSPAPSVVSSVSDEFIRGDCIALNISSRRPDNNSFDFGLHGADLLGHSTPSKKKKKKKSKDPVTSTPVISTPETKSVSNADECFATPKSKAKNKKQKTKSYTVSLASIPNPDVYDSDSNQSTISTNNNKNTYEVTNKSLPSTDVYESDSSLSETLKDNNKNSPNNDVHSSDSNISLDHTLEEIPKSVKSNNSSDQINKTTENNISVVDLTESEDFITLDNTGITESIVMGNVTGFPEPEYSDDDNILQSDALKLGSTKVPAILNEDLDFDNLKGKEKVCKKRRYSLTTLRAEMEKFYNESWGGEDFNHREIQKSMSRDKSLWVIDPKDRMPSMQRRKTQCNYCNRVGHRDDTCRMKPAVCYMCGSTGHYEPRCPKKICVNCGSPNSMYSTMCRNCYSWRNITCAECGQNGHPSSHCPDMWRRYHNTIDNNSPLERSTQTKKYNQMYCSGCTRRGHLIHTCRSTVPFSDFPVNSPYVCLYRPIFPPTPNTDNQRINKQLNKTFPQDSTVSSEVNAAQSRADRNKRQSKSPTAHESHVNKKNKNVSLSEITETCNTEAPPNSGPQRKISQSKDEDANKNKKETNKNASVDNTKTATITEKAPNFIPITSTNHDKKGHMIQDSEVSDTSDVITSSRIYVTNEIIEKLKTKEGEDWLKMSSEKYNVTVQPTDVHSFLSIKGKLTDQEAFQSDLRDWINYKTETNKENTIVESNQHNNNTNEQDLLNNIPRKRFEILRKLSRALESLKTDLGDPNSIYKEFTYLQNRHQQLVKQRVVNPQQLSKNRGHMNEMLKKLNMVLIGQAGLGDGSDHLNILYSFQEKLMNSKQKTIPPELRKEIASHYRLIFTPFLRDDYLQLLKEYYVSNQTEPLVKKRKNEKPFQISPKKNRLVKKMISVPSQKSNSNFARDIQVNDNMAVNKSMQMKNKLMFYHKRVLHTRPSNSALKKTRVDLVRKLHTSIASLFKNENMPSKNLKKMKKIQEQAQLFLANV